MSEKHEPKEVSEMKEAAEVFRRVVVKTARDSSRGLPQLKPKATPPPEPPRDDTPTVPIGRKLSPA